MTEGVVGIWSEAGRPQRVAVYLQIAEGLSRGRETDCPYVASEGKTDQGGKLWGEIFQLNTRQYQ